MTKFHLTKNEMILDELYVVLSRDEDKTEGIVSCIADTITMPMVFGNPKFIDTVINLAKDMSQKTGRKLYLMKYKKTEQLIVIDESH